MKKPRDRTFPFPRDTYFGKDHFWLTPIPGGFDLDIRRDMGGSKAEVKRAMVSLRDWLNEGIEYIGGK